MTSCAYYVIRQLGRGPSAANRVFYNAARVGYTAPEIEAAFRDLGVIRWGAIVGQHHGYVRLPQGHKYKASGSLNTRRRA